MTGDILRRPRGPLDITRAAVTVRVQALAARGARVPVAVVVFALPADEVGTALTVSRLPALVLVAGSLLVARSQGPVLGRLVDEVQFAAGGGGREPFARPGHRG